MANLILLANGFPYGNWEPYLETEVEYYNGFDKKYICSLQIRKEHLTTIRNLSDTEISICPVPYASKIVYFINSIRAIFDKNFYSEIVKLITNRKLNPKRLQKLVIFISRSHYEARIILKYLKNSGAMDKNSMLESGIIYSYRFEYQPYVAILLKKYFPNYKLVTRAHRFDLYEEERDVSYIPMREYFLSMLDKIMLIAEDGRKYLASKYPLYAKKLIVSRLGTVDYGEKHVNHPCGEINLVSCSTCTSVKRIHLIVEALSTIKDIKVNWTHYGEGEKMSQLVKLSKEILPSNITWNFRGYISNSQLLQEYNSENYHLFLNVSSSEGVPVSIMEALSFGMPCIATDVGGTSEIINHGKNGILLEKEFNIGLLAEWISKFSVMKDDTYQAYRKNARISWENKYSANNNYSKFVECLITLINGSNEDHYLTNDVGKHEQ